MRNIDRRYSVVLVFFFALYCVGAPTFARANSTVAKKRKKKAKSKTKVEASVDARTGAFSGELTNRFSGVFEEIQAKIRPEFQQKDWRLQIPLSIRDRRTAFASLDETGGALGLRLRYRKTRALALTLRADLSGRWRGKWLDPYQPLANGELGETDRQSRWKRKVGMDLASVFKKKHHAKISYAYEVYDYKEDPNFNALDAPTHIVPGDRIVHSAKLKWLRWSGKTKMGGGLNLARQASLFAFARDAGTGKTHAGAGGLPPNPLEVLVEAEPFVAWEYGRLKDKWQLDLSYGVSFVSDRFEGYYSSVTQHPEVKFSWKISDKGRLKTGAGLRWKRYGSNGYAPGGSRPALDSGERRIDQRTTFDLEYEFQIRKHWSVIVAGNGIVRRTNYPDYVPNVYPVNREYDIQWDYTNLKGSVGLLWHRE